LGEEEGAAVEAGAAAAVLGDADVERALATEAREPLAPGGAGRRPTFRRCDVALPRGEKAAEADLAVGSREHGLDDAAAEARQCGLVHAEPDAQRRAVVGEEVGGDVVPCALVAERAFDGAAEKTMRAGVESADDPPVDDTGPAVAQYEDVAGVRVGV